MAASTEAIRETASNKRGRPRLFSQEWESFMRPVGAFGKCASRHGTVNRWYAQRAVQVLFMPDRARVDPERKDRFRWLCDEDKDLAKTPGAVRWTLLAELGRIADDDLLLAAADSLCQTQPKSKPGVAFLRRVRLGKSKLGDPVRLARELAVVVDGYLSRFPDTTPADVLEAVARVEAVARRM